MRRNRFSPSRRHYHRCKRKTFRAGRENGWGLSLLIPYTREQAQTESYSQPWRVSLGLAAERSRCRPRCTYHITAICALAGVKQSKLGVGTVLTHVGIGSVPNLSCVGGVSTSAIPRGALMRVRRVILKLKVGGAHDQAAQTAKWMSGEREKEASSSGT